MFKGELEMPISHPITISRLQTCLKIAPKPLMHPPCLPNRDSLIPPSPLAIEDLRRRSHSFLRGYVHDTVFVYTSQSDMHNAFVSEISHS